LNLEQIRRICRPLPLRGELSVTATDHGFIRVDIQTKQPKWEFTAFAVWPDATESQVRDLYRQACERHARGYAK
jgi:hypothetical protein